MQDVLSALYSTVCHLVNKMQQLIFSFIQRREDLENSEATQGTLGLNQPYNQKILLANHYETKEQKKRSEMRLNRGHHCIDGLIFF